MQLAKIRHGTFGETIALVENNSLQPLETGGALRTLSDLLESPDPAAAARSLSPRGPRLPLDSVALLAPIDQQEVWAAGVTYRRSKVARMEESKSGAIFYDKVYEAARPELFFKATPHRVVGHGAPVRIRFDAKWNVPEPELTLVLNSRMQLVGFTAGNDMSSRDIEGENPLYLPQAKVYNGCCALGPVITLAGPPLPPGEGRGEGACMPPVKEIGISLAVKRAGQTAFSGQTSIEQMARTFEDLISWLARENSFPHGVFLLTGTGIVPGDDFTLAAGDIVEIRIDGIGTLRNPVVQE
jgi:2-dehydro-3-deoxy-D-arabinonate dehydratase